MSRPKPSSRINGRLSRGPKTQAGKDRVKMNALRHGLCASDNVLADESPEEFTRQLNIHTRTFPPANDAEDKLIVAAASARVGIRRTVSYETEMLTRELQQQTTGDPQRRSTEAAFNLVTNGTLNLIMRYHSRFNRAYNRSLDALLDAHPNTEITERT